MIQCLIHNDENVINYMYVNDTITHFIGNSGAYPSAKNQAISYQLPIFTKKNYYIINYKTKQLLSNFQARSPKFR